MITAAMAAPPDRRTVTATSGRGGWAGLVGDLGELSEVARREHPDLPLVILGHSMGSFALQQYLLDHSDDLDAAVLSGTTAIDIVAPEHRRRPRRSTSARSTRRSSRPARSSTG